MNNISNAKESRGKKWKKEEATRGKRKARKACRRQYVKNRKEELK